MKIYHLRLLLGGGQCDYVDVEASHYNDINNQFIFYGYEHKIICVYPICSTVIESIEEDEFENF